MRSEERCANGKRVEAYKGHGRVSLFASDNSSRRPNARHITHVLRSFAFADQLAKVVMTPPKTDCFPFATRWRYYIPSSVWRHVFVRFSRYILSACSMQQRSSQSVANNWFFCASLSLVFENILSTKKVVAQFRIVASQKNTPWRVWNNAFFNKNLIAKETEERTSWKLR